MGNWFTGRDPERYDSNTQEARDARTFGVGGVNHSYDVGGTTAQGSQAQAYTADRSQSDQARTQLQGLSSMLTSAAQGQGPSGAGLAAQAQRDSALSQASALQSGRRGQSAAAGALIGQNAVTLGNQQASQNEAIGRANEMATARGQLGGVLSGIRSQDLQSAHFDAGQLQQGSQFNSSQAQQNAQFNASQQQQANLANQAAQLGISSQELQARMEQERMRYGNLDPGSGGFLGSALKVGTTLGAAALVSDRNAKVNVSQVGGTGQVMGIGQRIMPVGRTWYDRAAGAIEGTVGTLADAYLAKRLETKAKEDTERKRIKDAAPAVVPVPVPVGPVTSPFADDPLAPYRRDESGKVVSDEKAKKEARRMFGELKPYSYEYKDDAGMPPGRHVGVMAQDLERSPAGRALVGRDDASGYKEVDYLKGLPTMMAGLADIESRLERIEKRGRRS